MTSEASIQQGDQEDGSPLPEQPESSAGQESEVMAAVHAAWRLGPAHPRDGGRTWGCAEAAMDSAEEVIPLPGGTLAASLEAQRAGQVCKGNLAAQHSEPGGGWGSSNRRGGDHTHEENATSREQE